MAQFLAVGNLCSQRSVMGRLDMKILMSNPEMEFLHTGYTRDDMLVPQRRSRREILRDALNGKYELVFAGNNAFPYPNPRKSWMKNCANLAWELLRSPHLLSGGLFPYSKLGSRLAGIDMDDRPIIDNRWFGILDSCACFFKRELFQNPCNSLLYTTARTECNGNVLHSAKFRRWIKKLRPISLGLPPEFCSEYSGLKVPKKTDVFFAGALKNRPNRTTGLRLLEVLKKEGWEIDLVQGMLPRDEFLRRCAQAHIVWSPEGFGYDCHRHYEVSLLGSVPLMQTPTIQRYAPLMEGEHALYYFVEGDDLAACVRKALQNRAKLVEMGQAARQHVLRWHTYEALARYIVEETRRTIVAEKDHAGNDEVD
jgi:hypothetical protein